MPPAAPRRATLKPVRAGDGAEVGEGASCVCGERGEG